jgi:hypothetical protein
VNSSRGIEEHMEVQIMKAIPRASRLRWLAFFVTTVLALGWVGKTYVGPELRAYLSVKDPVEAIRRFQWVMIAIGAGLVPFAAYLAVVAARIIRSGQFPYPGMTVWRDTPIVRGTRALVQGWTIAFLAVLLLGLAVYAAYIPTIVASHRHPAVIKSSSGQQMGLNDGRARQSGSFGGVG